MDELEELLSRKDGRLDLSSFPFSHADQVVDKFSFRDMDVVMVNKPVFRGRRLRSLDKIDGRWDLRGFDFSLRPGDIPFSHYRPDGSIYSKLRRMPTTIL